MEEDGWRRMDEWRRMDGWRMEDGFFHGMEMETTGQILTNHADYMPRVCVCVRVRRADAGASYGRMSLMTFTSGLPPFHNPFAC